MPYAKKEKNLEYQKLYREKHREKAKAYSKEYLKRKPPPPDEVRRRKLKHKYGITLADYDFIFEQQEGRCKTCGRHQVEFSKRLAVDHCHTTGKIRGLLCDQCNQALGLVKEKVNTLEQMIAYIKYHSS